ARVVGLSNVTWSRRIRQSGRIEAATFIADDIDGLAARFLRIDMDAPILIGLLLAAFDDEGTVLLVVLLPLFRVDFEVAVQNGVDQRFTEGDRHPNESIFIAQLHPLEVILQM